MKLDQLEDRATMEKMAVQLLNVIAKKGVDFLFSQTNTIQQVLGISQHDIQELVNETNFYIEHKEWDKAAKTLLFLLLTNLKNEGYCLKLGSVFREQNKLEEAIKIYEMAANLNPKDPRPHLYLAGCFLELKDRDTAKQAFENCLEICKNSLNSQEIEKLAKEGLKSLK